jgi:O-antigen ligase
VLCLGFLLVSSRTARGSRLALSPAARLALVALLALAGWSALSALWSPSPDIAIADAQRISGYALAFALGIWLATLAGKRLELALVPLAFAGLFAGIVTAVVLLTGNDFLRYIDDGTLQYPLGYRNANAAFFLVAMWAAVGLAATNELDWRLRALALGAATLCLEIAALSQSRGSMIAIAVALVVFLVVSRDRARGLAWLVLAILPALVVIPAVADLYQTDGLENYEGVTELRTAGRALLGGTALAVLIGGVATLVGRRLRTSTERLATANRAVAIAAVAVAIAGAAGFTAATGDPAGWIEDRVDEFLTQGTPGSEERSSRFGVNAGSERDDLWRVALDEAGDEPLLGSGGGGFQYAYLIRRSEEGIESVRDAHSVELEILSELGIPGLALFALVIGGAVAGIWRARRAGPGAAALATIALTVGAYWLVHSSLDWFWTYPAVTAPVFALLGSACVAGTPTTGTESGPTAWRRVAAVGAAFLALSVVPPFLSERYVEAAYDGWRADPERAQADLDRARDLNALSIEPLLAEGGIARARGEREQAIAAFEEAVEKRPEEWATHYFLALLNSDSPAVARAELNRALELNPLSPDLARLELRLER